MSWGLDTSVIVRLLIGQPEDQATAARKVLEQGCLVSDLVVAEAHHVLRHHYQVPSPVARSHLSALLADPRVQGTGVAAAVLAMDWKGGAGFLDRLIHADYGREGAGLLSFDREAAKLESAELL